jgi:multidrug efflux pump subunit AcrA (membrane-fusion protein)
VSIVDWTTYEVTASLTTTEVQGVEVGQAARITVDGMSGSFDALVTRVGPVDESDSSYVYPLVMTITSPTGGIPDGSAAQGIVQLAEAQDVLVVPTSAVHTSGTDDSYVYLEENGEEVRRSVKVGLVGSTYTQIESGLTRGEVVVLANPSESVPSSSSNTTTFSGRGGSGTAGGFGGTGGFGGGGDGPPGG